MRQRTQRCRWPIAAFSEQGGRSKEVIPKAKAAAQKSILALDETLSDAHTALAFVRTELRLELECRRNRVSPGHRTESRAAPRLMTSWAAIS